MSRISPSSGSSTALCFFAALCLLIPTLVSAKAAPVPALPLKIPPQKWVSLLSQRDPELQRLLEIRLRTNTLWSTLLKNQKMAVGLVDLQRLDAPRLASVNGNNMMYAASLPKIALLLAAVQAFEDGTLEETPDLVEDLHAMIRFSSNRAAARIHDLLGYERIIATLTSPRYKLFDPRRGGGLWVGKRYAKTGPRLPDPLRGISHAATADQVCRFYHMLATGRLISPERSRQMLEIMDNPGIQHKFVFALHNTDPETHLYRKSGTWKIWHADSVMVWGQKRYILVGLVEHPEGERILRELVPAAEAVLAQYERQLSRAGARLPG